MKDYILSIISIILLATAVGIILPEGKTGKFIRGIFALVTLVVILTPLMSGQLETTIVQSGSQNEIQYDEDFLHFIDYEKSQRYADSIRSYVTENGYECDMEITYENEEYRFKIIKVSVNLKNSGISNGDEHIYKISEMKQTIAEYCGIDEGKVYINEVPEQTEKQ